MNPLSSLIHCGTKLWLDSIDPDLVASNRALGATGATSNPVIVSDLIKTGRFDSELRELLGQGLDDSQVAWTMTDRLVSNAQRVFMPVWEQTRGNDGYVSFEIDPLLEDPVANMPHAQRVAQYVGLGTHWAAANPNRMIKVPATPAGLESLEALAELGITLNVTLIFSANQYRAARDAIWRGALRRGALEHFKSVYSIFVSRIDVYTEQHVPQLSAAAQGMVGIVNAKRIWRENRTFWQATRVPLDQEIVFASTGTKKPGDPAWKYVDAFAGSDIQTNPPATNDAVQSSGRTFSRHIDELPAEPVLNEIDAQVDFKKLEHFLMVEGIRKFADPQKSLLRQVASYRG